MRENEEKKLFALEEQFEAVAKNTALTPHAKREEMRALIERMQAVALEGFRVDPELGAHLAETCLDYLDRDDLAPRFVDEAFGIFSPSASVHYLHADSLKMELRRVTRRLSARVPTAPIAAIR